MICPYCKGEMIGKASKYGWFFGCENWPECDSTVGCHPGTRKPLGTPANRELKDLRMAVHAKIDPLWKSKQMTRKRVYKDLANGLRIKIKDCHIGMFDVETCKKALTINFNQNVKGEK